MRVFGIDCGTEFTGYGVVEMDGSRAAGRGNGLVHVGAGTIRLKKKEATAVRLAQVFRELTGLLGVYEAGRGGD